MKEHECKESHWLWNLTSLVFHPSYITEASTYARYEVLSAAPASTCPPEVLDLGILTHWTHLYSYLQVPHFLGSIQIHGYFFQCLLVPLLSPFKCKLLDFLGVHPRALSLSSPLESPNFYFSNLGHSPKKEKVLEKQIDTWDPACISQNQNSSISQSSCPSLGNLSQPIRHIQTSCETKDFTNTS